MDKVQFGGFLLKNYFQFQVLTGHHETAPNEVITVNLSNIREEWQVG